MKRTKLALGATLSILLSTMTIGSFIVSAVPTPPSAPGTGEALEIAPPVLNLTANPGQSLTAQINLRDISSGPLVVDGQVNDFVAAGEDGTPKILIGNDAQANNPYSLRNWISQLAELKLVPRQIKTLPVVIHVPTNASPGGYYGVIRFTAVPPELKDTGVSLSASLGSLVLLRVNGQAKESLSVVQFSASKDGKTGSLFESSPISFEERIQNEGNVFEQPAGQVSVSDMFGHTIANVNVNLPPGNILPQSIRKFTQPLDSSVLGNKKLFGHYTATLNMTYGANKQKLTDRISFWIIPYRLIAIVIIVLIGGFFLLRYLLRAYNRRIISKARQTRR